MSNYNAAKAIIGQLSGTQSTIGVPRAYCEFMGSLEGGALLSQIVYWSDKGRGGWFYKTYEEWESDLLLSKYKIKKYSDSMVEMGFLETKIAKANGAPTLHYRLNFEVMIDRLSNFLLSRKVEILTMESEKTSQSLTETTATDYQKHSSACADNTPDASQDTKKEPIPLPVAPQPKATSQAPPLPVKTASAMAKPAGMSTQDYYQNRREAAHDAMIARMQGVDLWESKQPVTNWFAAHKDAPRDIILDYARFLRDELAMEPIWRKPKDVQSWLSGIWDVIDAAKGNVQLARDTAQRLRMEGMTLGNPYALVKSVRSDAAMAQTPQYTEQAAYQWVEY